MFIFDVLELAVGIAVGAFLLFQVIAPLWCGSVLFPFFRRRAVKLAREERQAKFDAELKAAEDRLAQRFVQENNSPAKRRKRKNEC